MTRHNGLVVSALCAFACAIVPAVQAQDSVTFKVSLMLDVVYSASALQSSVRARQYTLQPSRDREIGLMLGHVRLEGRSSNLRGQLTLQEGWFPQANYQGADAAWRNVQEAFLGFRVADSLWIDAGIIPSHIGYESMVARDNPVLSRSLAADLTPYYATGVAVTWTPRASITVSAFVLNGWQRIVENNNDVALGTQLQLRPTPYVTLNWSTYIGNDQPTGTVPRTHLHNNLWARWQPSKQVEVIVHTDVSSYINAGHVAQAGLITAWKPTPVWALAARVERLDDSDALYIRTPNMQAFNVSGASINVDHRPIDYLLIRIEARHLQADFPIFSTATGLQKSDTYFTVSFSVDFRHSFE